SGAYLPLTLEEGRAKSSLYVGAGSYLGRGARVESELVTPGSSSRVAWDHVGNTAVELDAPRSLASYRGTRACRAEAEHGLRGRVAPSSLELAARRMDRARLAALHAGDLVLGLGVRTDLARGSRLDDYGALGPELFIAYGKTLDPQASVELA